MRNLKRTFYLLGFLFPLTGFPQNGLEVLKLEYGFYPGNTIESRNGDTFEATSRIFNAAFRAPVFITEQWQVLGSARFKNFQTEQDEYDFLRNLSGVALNFTALRRFEKWNIYGATEVNYSSDKWTEFSGSDLIFRGSAGIIQFRKGAVKMWGIGMGASSDFGVPTVIPVAFFKSEINKKWQIETILPLKSRLSYQWKTNTYLGLQHFINYNAFIISPEFRTEELKFGKIRNFNGAVFFEQKLHRNLWLALSSGALFRNVIFLYDENRHETDKLVSKMNYFLNLKLAIKINRNERDL